MITARQLASGAVHRFARAALRAQLLAQFDLGLLSTYQPNPFTGRSPGDRGDPRRCRERFDALSAALPAGEPLSVLDVGCSIGYFTFRFAERGGFCLGLDYERHPILAAHALAAVHEIPNVAFARVAVDASTARGLPRCDALVCLSVFHHWARKLGERGACEVLAALAERAGRYVVFETGQADETGARWTGELAFMRPDPDAWIRTFLAGVGFERVLEVGRFPTTVSPVPRALYVAARDGSDLDGGTNA